MNGLLKKIVRCLAWAFEPVRRNAVFFVMMYVLGVVCAWIEQPPKGKLYEHLYSELFLDLYLICLLLSLIPLKVRTWVRGVLAVLFYLICLTDVYCYVKFGSALTPMMLMLVGETNAREAGDFVTSMFSMDILLGKMGWVWLIVLVHIGWNVLARYLKKHRMELSLSSQWKVWGGGVMGLQTIVLLVVSVVDSWPNKEALGRVVSLKTTGQVEHELTRKDCFKQYVAPYRLWFSVWSNQLAVQQIDKLVAAADQLQVDSCSFTTPEIVLIVGESFGRHHSQQYGYFMPTTPRQIEREHSGMLVKFTDVVSPWNLTSFVFKNVLSLHVVGQEGEWCDYPLFPELFHKAGYEVTFLTNQYLPQNKVSFYDFSGGFFLNNPRLSRVQFDRRNDKLYKFDHSLVEYYDQLEKDTSKCHLTIIQLLGQHVDYRVRCPKKQMKFTADDYVDKRPELNGRQRKMLAWYDNATLYNDSIVDQIIRRFEDRNAVVIYMPDHGEECYEGNRGFICRNHSAEIDYDLAHFEFEIPFWIYCSHAFAVSHPEIYKQILEARNRRMMTDALPHLLLYLAGIHCKDYQAKYNVLSPDYDEKRPRLLKGSADYDQLRTEHEQSAGDNALWGTYH